ncbi:MAG: TIGR00153 family protein [Clostridia bacterium]|nr:TIGR00153 family protein [Clostridia bacterium]
MFTKSTKTNTVHILLLEQLRDVESCLLYFESFMRAACTKETVHETLKSLAVNVSEAEAKADISLRKMIDSLQGHAYLPSTREDIISVATSCDKIANKCEAIANHVVYQRFNFPEQFAEDFLKIVAITHDQFEVLEKAITKLFTNFGELLKDHSILDEIRSFESMVDKIEHKLNEEVYALDIELAAKMQLAKYVESVCDISDTIENIADKMQIMLITRKA